MIIGGLAVRVLWAAIWIVAILGLGLFTLIALMVWIPMIIYAGHANPAAYAPQIMYWEDLGLPLGLGGNLVVGWLIAAAFLVLFRTRPRQTSSLGAKDQKGQKHSTAD